MLKGWSCLLALALLLCDVQATAKTFSRHELSIWGASGVSTLKYNPKYGKRKTKFGYAFGGGYTFYFHRDWGIHIGAETALYSTAFRSQNLRDAYTRYGFDDLTPGWTGENELIDYHVEVSNYTERQHLYSLNIPLTLEFQMPLADDGSYQFFASLGTKLGMATASTYRVDARLYTWYYDHKSNQEFRPDPTGYGTPYLEDLGCFYNYPYSTEKQRNKFKVAGLITAEAGVKYHFRKNRSAYVSAYLDYGFTNISKESGNRFFEFDSEDVRMISNSILTSQCAGNGGVAANFTKRITPLSFGVKLRIGISKPARVSTNI